MEFGPEQTDFQEQCLSSGRLNLTPLSSGFCSHIYKERSPFSCNFDLIDLCVSPARVPSHASGTYFNFLHIGYCETASQALRIKLFSDRLMYMTFQKSLACTAPSDFASLPKAFFSLYLSSPPAHSTENSCGLKVAVLRSFCRSGLTSLAGIFVALGKLVFSVGLWLTIQSVRLWWVSRTDWLLRRRQFHSQWHSGDHRVLETVGTVANPVQIKCYWSDPYQIGI